MKPLAFAEFDQVYRSSLDEVWPHWSEGMQTEIARHCAAWAPGRIDFYEYLLASSIRFYYAYQTLVTANSQSLCDVGGFWGVWPITAKKLGVERVAMTETLRYYGDSFGPLFDKIRESGIQIHDIDPFDADTSFTETFDFVSVMAVLEHYPHSLRTLIKNVKRLTAAGGRIYLEVPNIAYWPKRTAMLAGNTPLARIEDIYASEEPFIGHHHEFTLAELRSMAELAGLKITDENCYNYTLSAKNPIKLMLRHPILSLALALSPTSRECLAVACEVVPNK